MCRMGEEIMKKGKVLQLFSGLMLCMALCGCGAVSRPEQSTKTVEELTSQNQSDDTADAETDTAQSAETDTAQDAEADTAQSAETAAAQDAVTEPDTADPVSVYRELLDGIRDLIQSEEFWSDTELVCEAENGILEAQYSGISEELQECVGYAFPDINADGMPELVVCAIAEAGDGKYLGRDICAVYTCVQEKIHCICSGWARNYVGWMGDNTFYYFGSGGATNTLVGQYEFLPGATEWTCVDLYLTDENGIYHNQTGAFETEASEMSDMTWDELWELNDALYENVQQFELTPFSAYTHTGD